MKTSCRVNVCLLVAIFCCVGRLYAVDAPLDSTLKGYFTWPGDKTGSRGVSPNKDGKCEIKMVLTPDTAPNEFKAAFLFTWDKHEQNWKGTFKRNPQTGETTGTTGKWVFRGKTTNGTIACQYFELKNGQEVAGGDIVFNTTKQAI